MTNRLTTKQSVFVQEYLVDLCATKAAIRAGYSKKSAMEIGYENLRKPQIQTAIQKAMAERSERTKITIDMVVAELAKPGFIDIRKIFTPAGNLISPADLPADVAAAIQSIEVVVRPTGERDEDDNPIVEHVHKIRFHDKIKSLELIGKHLGMFNDFNKAAQGDINITLRYGEGKKPLVLKNGEPLDDSRVEH